MAHTVPLYIPLVKGLDLSKEAVLGEESGLQTALNVDYAVDGRVQGRPSRAAAESFVVRDPGVGGLWLSPVAFSATGFTARGLMRMREASGDHVALGCDGRLFVRETTRWMDRGPFACMKVDRLYNFESNLNGLTRDAAAQDFGTATTTPSSNQTYRLLTSEFAYDREAASTVTNTLGGARGGNSARCGTTTAIVTMTSVDTKLWLVYRANGADTVTTVQLATDARTPGENGDTPTICCDFDQTVFYVAYRTTTANVVKVLRVSTTGTVTATYTSAAIAGIAGHWVSNTAVSGNKVLFAFTTAAGITIRQLNATTMADLALDATHDGSDGAGTVGLDVVVGAMTTTTAYWAYRNSNAVGDGDIVIGTANLTAPSLTRVKKFWGGDTYSEAAIRWGIAHQPVVLNGRTYLTLIAAAGRATTGTWITIDVTNYLSGVSYSQMVLVARGPTEATYPHFQPSTATLLSDSTGWTFQTIDWSRFETNASGSTTGLDASMGITRVAFSRPRSALVGESTVFSGSVPHHTSRGLCAELGFPFLAGVPGLSASATGGGAVGIGDYGVVACWRWTDEAGQIHRGAPTVIRTVNVPGGGNSTITAVVTNPWLTEKQYGDLKIELYCTDLNPTADGLHYLQSTTAMLSTAAYTTITITTQPVTTTEAMYIDGGVFGHYHVPGDGGVTTVGRRLWMAGATAVYASKLLEPGFAPSFNDEGALQVNLPAGAGRVVSLESLDDKLLVFCARGVYIVQDGGPDNTGLGGDFPPPIHLSDLGIAGPRASCPTDGGVVFCTALDTTDASRGGPWMIDRQLTLTERQYLGRPALRYFLGDGSWVPEVAYSSERQQVYISVPDADGAGNSGLVVIDMRVGKWATWAHNDAAMGTLSAMTAVNGHLWTLGDGPAPFSGVPGSDATGDYAMTIATGHLYSNGTAGLGWGRVISISPMGTPDSGAHSLTITALQDQMIASTSGAIAMTAPALSTTWPANRQAPEWSLPMKKCSSIQVELSATPATAQWAAIRLDVRPLGSKAPAKQRS